jgi:hypothetical protein
MRRRPGKPIEMRSDVPSHVTSVRTTTKATSAIVRRRGTVAETYSRDARHAPLDECVARSRHVSVDNLGNGEWLPLDETRSLARD